MFLAKTFSSKIWPPISQREILEEAEDGHEQEQDEGVNAGSIVKSDIAAFRAERVAFEKYLQSFLSQMASHSKCDCKPYCQYLIGVR